MILPFQKSPWLWWLVGGLAFAAVYLLWGFYYYQLSASEFGYDLIVHHARAVFFLEHGSWQGMGYNEYPPGALWYFVFVAALTPPVSSTHQFIVAALLLNVGLAGVSVFLYARIAGVRAALIGVLLQAAMGPVLLFRFEFAVGLLVLIAWHMLRQHRLVAAAGLLGLATALKIYPVVILPVFLLQAMYRRQWREVWRTPPWQRFSDHHLLIRKSRSGPFHS